MVRASDSTLKTVSASLKVGEVGEVGEVGASAASCWVE